MKRAPGRNQRAGSAAHKAPRHPKKRGGSRARADRQPEKSGKVRVEPAGEHRATDSMKGQPRNSGYREAPSGEMATPDPTAPAPCPAVRLKAGALLEGVVDRIQEQGYGVIQDLYRPLLVPNALPGETLRLRVTHMGAHRAVAAAEEILRASPHRIEAFCDHADRCGGCDFGFMDYPAQLRWKSDRVARAMDRAGVPLLPSRLRPILASPSPLHYRNKLAFNVKFAHPRIVAGLFERHSHRTLDIDDCPLQEAVLNTAVPAVKRAVADRRWPVYNEMRKTGSLRGFSLRCGTDGRMLLTLVVKRPNLAGIEEQAAAWIQEIDGLAGVLLNVHPADTNAAFSNETLLVAGEPSVTATLAGLSLEVRPTAFFQVNTAQAERMIEAVSPDVQGCRRLVDAYCGGGLWGLALAAHAQEVIGLDGDPHAVAAAQANASANRIPHARFIQGDVEETLAAVLDGGDPTGNLLLLDPPRKGLAEPLRRLLVSAPLQRIVYVSCNPATLARDLADLCTGGYELTGLQPVDMFPQTRHVESIAFLSR